MLVPCHRCGYAFDPDRSTSSLRLTWCGIFCEIAELGYVLREFEKQPLPIPWTTVLKELMGASSASVEAR